MAAGTGAPVRRAQVRAMSMEGRGGGVTSTDAEGRFEIKELPAGRYNVMRDEGRLRAWRQFGQRRPGEPGTPIDLADGQTAEKVNFVLSRGSVIAGRIVDDGGEPVSGTQVAAMRLAVRGRHAPAGAGRRRGQHRSHRRSRRLPAVRTAARRLLRQRDQSQQHDDGPGMNNTEADGFAPTYYPGTPNIGEATRVTVKAGQEMTGANFALIVARMARVRGRALNSRGEPVASAMLMLAPADPSMGMGFMNMNNAMVGGRRHVPVRQHPARAATTSTSGR